MTLTLFVVLHRQVSTSGFLTSPPSPLPNPHPFTGAMVHLFTVKIGSSVLDVHIKSVALVMLVSWLGESMA